MYMSHILLAIDYDTIHFCPEYTRIFSIKPEGKWALCSSAIINHKLCLQKVDWFVVFCKQFLSAKYQTYQQLDCGQRAIICQDPLTCKAIMLLHTHINNTPMCYFLAMIFGVKQIFPKLSTLNYLASYHRKNTKELLEYTNEPTIFLKNSD